jgi:DNA-binding CsgD family transcriptional regulator
VAAAGLIGRDEELAAIRALLAESRPGGLLLSGEPGIGKTVLWEAGVAEARAAGWTVLQHRSAQAEAGLAFAALTDLIGDVFDDVADALPRPRRRALAVALLLVDPGQAPPESRVLGVGLLDVLRRLTDDAPVLLALDDVQWLDASSAAVIAIAARRLTGDRVALLATRRAEPGKADGPDLFGRQLEHIVLPPLDRSATDLLLRRAVGREFPRPTLTAIYRASGGNPYFATELARADAGGDGDGFRIPPNLDELLGGRLAKLPDPTMEVLLEAAALARPTVELLAGKLDALDVAVMDGIVRVDESEIRFTHPLLESLTYARAPPGKRRAAHARLAAIVSDPEERVRHRALAVGRVTDAALATELEEAGRHAAARGATASAADLAEMAARYTPTGDLDGARRRRRAAAGFLHLAGELARASALIDDLAAELPRGPERAEVLLAGAVLQRTNAESRTAVCLQALAEAGDNDGLAARILSYLAINRWLSSETIEGLADARAGLRRAERVGDPRLVAAAIACVSLLETFLLEATPGLLERGVELERGLGRPLRFQESPAFVWVIRLIHVDEIDEARRVLDELTDAVERHGDEHSRAYCGLEATNLELLAGRLDRAVEHGRRTMSLAEELEDDDLRVYAAGFAAGAMADAGHPEEATRVAGIALALAGDQDAYATLMAVSALGRLALLRGDLSEVRRLLEHVPAMLMRAGHRHPVANPWADLIEALIGLGELEQAKVLLVTYDDLAVRSGRWARTNAARCRGLLFLADGDDANAVAAFERSLEEEGGTYPLERGQTLLALGVAHRHARRNRAARETLTQAVGLLDDIGARAWRDKAVVELGRVSGRRTRRDDELTDAEQRVAELAAQGRKNKEIAATLFLGVSTVEMHLSRVYRKLGLRSRTELAGHFTAADPKTMGSPVSAADERT